MPEGASASGTQQWGTQLPGGLTASPVAPLRLHHHVAQRHIGPGRVVVDGGEVVQYPARSGLGRAGSRRYT